MEIKSFLGIRGIQRVFLTEEVLELAKANPEDWNKLCQDVDRRQLISPFYLSSTFHGNFKLDFL